MAGIGTLLFTGIATYFGAMVSRDQLEQSRDDAEKEARSQASRVSTWVDYAQDGGIQLHVMNRSPDPVSELDLFFEAHNGAPDALDLNVVYSLVLPDLPPCSDLVLDPSTWRYRTSGRDPESPPKSPIAVLPSNDGWKQQPEPDTLIVVSLRFVDRTGEQWWRDYGQLKSIESYPDKFTSEGAIESGMGGFTRIPKVQRTPSCDEAPA
ncbi:hypothetical protein IM697_18410 [Streptomyces ferrugineus]|uniref:Uncharacterized protein n=1 Tax=Streptomyces ferrugineus TaxID=1413221 RepID=A0A7M2SX28_9ACTN|nr:hypothetical protein [Streptomyces ferrugineus]QOV40195.1 hypothetical protein IM697_18410 [Streptomyces ferrugineus]